MLRTSSLAITVSLISVACLINISTGVRDTAAQTVPDERYGWERGPIKYEVDMEPYTSPPDSSVTWKYDSVLGTTTGQVGGLVQGRDFYHYGGFVAKSYRMYTWVGEGDHQPFFVVGEGKVSASAKAISRGSAMQKGESTAVVHSPPTVLTGVTRKWTDVTALTSDEVNDDIHSIYPADSSMQVFCTGRVEIEVEVIRGVVSESVPDPTNPDSSRVIYVGPGWASFDFKAAASGYDTDWPDE